MEKENYSLKSITDKMTVDLDMLGSFVKDGIGGNINSRPDYYNEAGWCSEKGLRDQEANDKPFEFTQSRSHRAIFSFCRRTIKRCVVFSFFRR